MCASKEQSPAMCSRVLQDKNCQSIQCKHMWPVKPAVTKSSHMQSGVTKSSQIQSMRPAMPYAHMWPVKVSKQSSHKKCQVKTEVAQSSHRKSVKPAMAQTTHMWTVLNSDKKQLDIQPEVARNNVKHAVLPIQSLHIGQQMMFEDSTSKHWYSAKSVVPEPSSSKIMLYNTLYT